MPSAETPTDRGALLLRRAIELVAEGGLGAVTHRAVENAAGAPHGSVTYWFGNRDGLISAMVDELAHECEAQAGHIATDVAAAFATGGPDIKVVAAAVAAWIDDGRDMHLARLELELAAVRDLRLREKMTEAAMIFWRLCEPLAAATGSDDAGARRPRDGGDDRRPAARPARPRPAGRGAARVRDGEPAQPTAAGRGRRRGSRSPRVTATPARHSAPPAKASAGGVSPRIVQPSTTVIGATR